MFLSLVVLGMVFMFFYLWGDYMKMLILIEILSLVFMFSLIFFLKMEYMSMNYFFGGLVFLVCESSLGFLLFIFYISMEFEVVSKLNLVMF